MEPPKQGMRRVTVRPKCPNPLFERWLDEWRQEAVDKGTDMQYCFAKALKSLRKYPLPLKSGKECIILECFGNRLCQLLDKKLVDYRKSHPDFDAEKNMEVTQNVSVELEKPVPSRKRKSPKSKVCENNQSAETAEPLEKVPRRSGGRKYLPAWRSGPYAILMTMLSNEEKEDFKGFMLKAELQREAQPLCDKSFTRPDPGSHYTAWSSMSLLIKKSLVHKYSNPAKFELTEEGRTLAKLLQSNASEKVPGNNLLPERSRSVSPEPAVPRTFISPPKPKPKPKLKTASGPYPSFVDDFRPGSSGVTVPYSPIKQPQIAVRSPNKMATSANGNLSSVVLEKGGFDVLLLVDTCETAGASKKRYDQTINELKQMKVPFEVRKLEVGDFLWIARSKISNDELVLPYVVERKRMDDLGGSIKDGRFKEQKFRLKQSGIQNLIYLVESHGSDQHVGLPLSTLQQAAVNTQVVDGFIVKHTIDHLHSMAYLASLTRILGRTFLKKTLLGCLKNDLTKFNMGDDFITLMTFDEFKQSTKKNRNFTVKEMFIRQLVQMKGLSVEKALAIVGRYPTPLALMQAYRVGGDETLLADIPCQGCITSRTVGPVTSKAVYFMYNSVTLH